MGTDPHDDEARRPPLVVSHPSEIELVVCTDDTIVQRHVLGAQQAWVGRRSDAAIVIPHGNVSRKQARFYLRDGRLFVEDGGSTGGTYVDGVACLGPTELGEGAVVSFGTHSITVLRRS